METIYNFSAMEIGDCVYFITKDWGVKYGRIVELHYYKRKGKEETLYKLETIISDGDMVYPTSSHVFKNADEALAYLEYIDKKHGPIFRQ